MKKVALLLADGFEEVEVVTPVDFLRRAGIDVLMASIGSLAVTGSHNIVIQADFTLESLPDDLDGIILPGGMPGSYNLSQSSSLIQLLTKLNTENKLVAAICAAPALVLGGAGLLKGRKFTCYPGCEMTVKGAEFSAENVVQDGNIITSRGPGTAAEFSIALIEYLLGHAAANVIKEETLHSS